VERRSLDADPAPDPTFYFDADLDPDPTNILMPIQIGKSEQIFFAFV
jgi:hypothetical protein